MIVERDGRLVVEGPITMETAAALYEQGEPLIGKQDRVLDLSAVSATDSAALALVLAWLRAARAAGSKLRIVSPPQTFASLAALYDVEDLLLGSSLAPDDSHSAATVL